MGVKFKVLNRSIPREDDIRDELRGVQSTVEFFSVNDILRHFLPSSVEVDGETPSLVTSRELNSVAVHVSCVVMLRKQQVDKVLGTVVECIQLEVQSLGRRGCFLRRKLSTAQGWSCDTGMERR